MITTIQLRENIKKELDRLKENDRDTYEEVILKLMRFSEQKRREQEELLIEGCKEMSADSLRITKEWETTDSTLDWEWEDENTKRRNSTRKS